MSWDQIENEISDWNKKNSDPLKEGYIKSQIDWLSGKSMEQLNALLKDMNNILVHNQKLYTDIEL